MKPTTMRRSAGLALALLLLGLATLKVRDVAAEERVVAVAATDPTVAHKLYKLDNGLEVLLIQDRSTPIIFVDVWYHVGSGDETPGKSGFAHLFEHMMFQGGKHIGEDVHFKILKEIGASSVNGTTNGDRTNYFEQVPSHQLEVALWLESDRMGYLLDVLTLKSLDNQREVVKNERRQRYDNVPYGKDRFAVAAALYAEGHPYRYLTIGLHEDVTGASVDDVKGFFRKWYVPSNATLCLAGDFELEEAEQLIAKWFGGFPKTAKPAHRQVNPTPVKKHTVVELTDEFAKLRRIHYAWHSPAYFAADDAEMEILASALGNSGTGRLYKVLVLEKQLARSVSVYQQSGQMSSTFHVVADLKDDADLKTAMRLIDEELEKVMKDPITDKELARVVTSVEASFVWGLESISSRAELLQTYNHYVGKPDFISGDLTRYRNASTKGVLAAASKYLKKQSRVDVITTPQTQKTQKGGAK